MQKIPTLFERDWDQPRNPIIPRYDPRCTWVATGAFVARRKWDGTAVLIMGDKMYKRATVKMPYNEPEGFVRVDVDEKTGNLFGWVPVDLNHNENRWYADALISADAMPEDYNDGTYELVGPKINGNPEKFDTHQLLRHDASPIFPDAPYTFPELLNFLGANDIEGIVFYATDGSMRMAKIKGSDFGVKRQPSQAIPV